MIQLNAGTISRGHTNLIVRDVSVDEETVIITIQVDGTVSQMDNRRAGWTSQTGFPLY